jgi:hypothetical protein|tara:strand:- start:1102 stop:1701 length:600 start_codon:yes stop_codon:yes gene_type:complete
MKFTKKLLAETLNKVSNGGKTFTSGKKQNVIISEEQLERVLSVVEEQWQEINLEEDAKPDFLDLDGDGDKKESMKKASKDKKEMDEGAKPDFLDLDGDGDKKESMKKASKEAKTKEVKEDSGHDEAMNYGKDEGHDDKELYDLKHDGGSEGHIDDLEDDMHYDHIHDSKNIEESQEEKERLIQEDIKKMKAIISPIKKI